jgi:hypothetical protein
MIARPGNMDIQLDSFLDYAINVKLYPKFREYFRQAKPPLLAIRARFDPFFIPPGAEAFPRDNPNAKVYLLNTGHFVLETHVADSHWYWAAEPARRGAQDPPTIVWQSRAYPDPTTMLLAQGLHLFRWGNQ